MKTALQELMQWMEETEFMVNEAFIDKVNECLEKEKDQIVNAFEVGYKSCDIDEAFEINRKLASGENHYNQTYKPETI